MTRALINPPKAAATDEKALMRSRVAEMVERRLIELYRRTGEERRRLSAERSPVNGGTLHGEIEIFSDDVAGFATSIAERGRVREPLRAMRRLLGMNGTHLLATLNRSRGAYPKLIRYVRETDNLQRLVIKFLERYGQSVEPTAAHRGSSRLPKPLKTRHPIDHERLLRAVKEGHVS